MAYWRIEEMTNQVDYQILLQEIVRTASKAAISAKDREDDKLLFAYYDILDVIKTQAEIMDIPLDGIGMEKLNIDDLLKASVEIAKQKQAA